MSIKEEIIAIEQQINKIKSIREELQDELKEFDKMLEKFNERND